LLTYMSVEGKVLIGNRGKRNGSGRQKCGGQGTSSIRMEKSWEKREPRSGRWIGGDRSPDSEKILRVEYWEKC